MITFTVPADAVKANNTDDLNLASSWVGGVLPSATGAAVWDSTVTADNTVSLGGNMSWGGINFTNPGGLVTINGGNTLTLFGNINLAAATTNLTLNCPLVLSTPAMWNVAANRTLTVAGAVSGANSLTKQGAGTAILSGTNSYSGLTTVSAGTLSLSGNNSGAIGDTTVSSGGTLQVSAANSFTAGTLTLNGGTLSLRNDTGTAFNKSVELAANSTINVDNAGSGTAQTHSLAAITQATATGRTLTVNAGNSYALTIGRLDLCPAVGGITTLTANGKVTVQDVTNLMNGWGGTVNVDTLTLSGTTTESVVTGVISDSIGTNSTTGQPASRTEGGVTKVTMSGTGTWKLSGTSLYSGATIISAGKLVGVTGGSASNSIVTFGAATCGVLITDTNLQWTYASLSNSTAATAGVLEFDFNSLTPSTTVAPLRILGEAAFTAQPSVTLVGTNLVLGTFPLMTWGSFSGTLPVAVTLPEGGVGSISNDATTLYLTILATNNVKANNTLALNDGNSWSAGVLPGVGNAATWDSTVTSPNTTVLGAPTTWGGIQIKNPNGLVTINNDDNTLTLGAAGTDIDLSAATADLTLKCPLDLGAANVWNVASNRTLTVAGAVSGANSLTKQGVGTAILSGTSSYYGLTTVSAGRLILSGDNSSAFGDTTISSGGALQVGAANNFTAGTLTLNGGTLSLRNDTGTDFNKSFVMTASSTINVDNAGSGMNQTLTLGTLSQATANSRTLTVNGGNGYGLTIIHLDLDPGLGQDTKIVADAKVTLQDVSNPMVGFNTNNFDTLTLNGTNTGSVVTGAIGDAIYTDINGNPASLANGGYTRIIKLGTGTWTLTGANAYSGPTIISAGKLVGVTGGSASSSAVTFGATTCGVLITDTNLQWTYAHLTNTAAGILEFNFNSLTPSPTVAPLQILGEAAFTNIPPTVTILGTKLAVGTFPLMTWGSFSGTRPTAVTLPVGAVGSISNDANALYLTILATNNVKANNTLALNNVGSWTGGILPRPGDSATWDATVTGPNTTVLGADTIWGGIQIKNPAGLVTINAGSTLTLGGAAIDLDLSAATVDLTLDCPLVLGAANVWNVATNRTLTVAGAVSGTNSLTKQGVGTAILSGNSTYSGATTVNGGTLLVNNSLASPVVNVNSGGTLGGTGTLAGAVTVTAGGTLQPGLGSSSTTTLTINNNLSLAGTTLMVLNRTNAQNSSRVVSLTRIDGGTLTVVNAGPAVAANDTFTLFSASSVSGSFSVTNLPDITPLAWKWNPTNGKLTAVAGVASNPTNISYTFSGGTLTLRWPESHKGWSLQVQTNTLTVGLSTNWVTVAGSETNTSVVVPVTPANPTVFYRMFYQAP